MSRPDGSAIPTPQGSAPLPPTYDDTGKSLDVGGGYRLVKKLGQGEFGEVWKAEAPGAVAVAVKIIARTLKPDEARRELEALELVKALRHQNLLSLQAYFSLADKLVIVLELADGDLGGRLAECQKAGESGIPSAELLRYMLEAAEALDFLHANQVQHRDIKPANVLLLGSHVKVAGFSLARLFGDKSQQSAMCVGTPLYMAPEMCSGKISPHSDQYSLALMYAELRGRYPYPHANIGQVVQAHLLGAPDLGHLGKKEQQALLRGLAKEPGQRYPSCTELVRSLVQAMMDDGASKQSRTEPAGAPGLAGQGRSTQPFPAKALPPMLKPAKIKGDIDTLEDVRPVKPQRKKVAGLANRPRLRAGWLGPIGLMLLGAAALIAVIYKVMDSPPTVTEPNTYTVDLGGVEMNFARINPGEFQMGTAGGSSDEQPRHKVVITRPFWIATWKTTQAQYQKVMGRMPSWFSATGDGKDMVAGIDTIKHDFPVEGVNWFDAIEFCNKLSERVNRPLCYEFTQLKAVDDVTFLRDMKGFRLPSEAEWEYCARAEAAGRKKGTKYWFGNDEEQLKEYIWFDGNSQFRTWPVGQKKPNPFGVYDMGGLLWEWCDDAWHEDYKGAPDNGSAWVTGGVQARRVLRGGSWVNLATWCRSADRSWLDAGDAGSVGGFRVVLVSPEDLYLCCSITLLHFGIFRKARMIVF